MGWISWDRGAPSRLVQQCCFAGQGKISSQGLLRAVFEKLYACTVFCVKGMDFLK